MLRRAWSNSAIYLGAAYFCAAAAMVSLTRFDGGFAVAWLSSALLIARLVTLPTARWPAPIAACTVAGFVASGWFGIGWLMAPFTALTNIGEALVGAIVLRRLAGDERPFESLGWFMAFLVACGLASPLAGAAVSGLVIHFVFGLDWAHAGTTWFIGHALGNLALAPFAIFGFNGDIRFSKSRARRVNARDLLACIALVLAISVVVFAQSRLPLLFLPTFAIMFTTFRFGRLGAMFSTLLVALVGTLFTFNGSGPVQLVGMGAAAKLHFLQLYMAINVLGILPLAIELSSRRRLFARLAESEARYRMLSDHSTDIIMNVDRQGLIRFISPSVLQLGGYRPVDLIGRSALDLVAESYHGRIATLHGKMLSRHDHAISTEYQAIRRDGTLCWFESSSRAVIDGHEEPQGVVSVIRDISLRKELEARLMNQALSDPLTGLPNRRAIQAKLAHEITGDRGACIAVCDLDNFKAINDRYGHAAGDAVLVNFGKVALGVLRDTDTVARVGGEEFVLLLRGITPEQASFVCDRLVRTFAETITVFDGVDIPCTISCGLAVLGNDPDRAMKAADGAVYRAKAAGRDRLMMAA